MTNNGVRAWLRLIVAASALAALSGCAAADGAIPSANGLGEQLQTFVTDLFRHLLAARMF